LELPLETCKLRFESAESIVASILGRLIHLWLIRLARLVMKSITRDDEDLVSQLVADKGEQVLSRGRSRTGDTSSEISSRKVVKAEDVACSHRDGNL
jgi:hypothetical protein